MKYPVIIPKNDVIEFMDKFPFKRDHLIFKTSIMHYDSDEGFIYGARKNNQYNESPISYFIVTTSYDNVNNKKWAIIRYYFRSTLSGTEYILFKRLLKKLKILLKNRKYDCIGIPRYLYDNVRFFNKTEKEMILKEKYKVHDIKKLVAKERISLYIDLK